MQSTIHSERDVWSTRGFSTVDPERQGVRAQAPQRTGHPAPREAAATPAAAAPRREAQTTPQPRSGDRRH
ncbi:MAG: hypothetical protein V4864_01695 [Pseudomonadota bacterium]